MKIPYSPYHPETKELYPFIRRAFRKQLIVHKVEYMKGVLLYEGVPYMIQESNTLTKHFKYTDKAAWCGVISLQQHRSGNYAIIQ